ncbi:phage tail protein [Salipiger pacificus]|nr:phage tail protein [Alloyangia pacifica]
MAYLTFNPPKRPDRGMTTQQNPRLLIAQFGDGYRQRTGDGINTGQKSVTPTWSLLTEAEADMIEAFFDAHKDGTAFDWQPKPGAAVERFALLNGWSRTANSFNNETVTATLTKVFDL